MSQLYTIIAILVGAQEKSDQEWMYKNYFYTFFTHSKYWEILQLLFINGLELWNS